MSAATPDSATPDWAKRSSTEITVQCNPTTGNIIDSQTTTICGSLTSKDKGISGSIKLFYQAGATGPNDPNHGNNWIPITTVTSNKGACSYQWNPSDTLPNGWYWIKAEFSGDASHQGNYAVTCWCRHSNLFHVPEYTFGALVSLAACFAALLAFKKYHPSDLNENHHSSRSQTVANAPSKPSCSPLSLSFLGKHELQIQISNSYYLYLVWNKRSW